MKCNCYVTIYNLWKFEGNILATLDFITISNFHHPKRDLTGESWKFSNHLPKNPHNFWSINYVAMKFCRNVSNRLLLKVKKFQLLWRALSGASADDLIGGAPRAPPCKVGLKDNYRALTFNFWAFLKDFYRASSKFVPSFLSRKL